MSLIELRDVTKTFSSGAESVTPVQGLDFDVQRGEFVCLMGPSGSGKTTLLHMLAGIDRPTEGSVVVDGERVHELAPSQLARWRTRAVGYVFQQYNLIPVLTAFENVEVPLLLLKMSKAERGKRIATALAAVGLTDRAHHLPRQMSGGQQQRVAIARAIVADPVVMFADEPTGNLDRESATTTMTLLRRLVDEFGKTLVMVTHDPQAAKQADRVVHLDKGQIVTEAADA
ncbi:MAG: ABC transporter ATP-binding protein [Planctomycetota bacterium]|nr:ABC transporter ATP-binding protein [Planctomycetota bacterium]MEC8653524.1 ABC transporter ATP-binding protein [Planctomycetota bacterium]